MIADTVTIRPNLFDQFWIALSVPTNQEKRGFNLVLTETLEQERGLT
jgi:hypothetical protein